MIEPGRYVELIEGRTGEPTEELAACLEDPNDGSFIAHQRATSAAAIEAALAAAYAAWVDGDWSELPIDERAAALLRLADALEPMAERVALVDALDSGVPISVTRRLAMSLGGSIRTIAREAVGAGELRLLEAGGRRVELWRRPWGPALILTPWNVPAKSAVAKLARSLAAGCPTILKPSEYAPSFAQAVAAAAVAAELPPGALQIVHGGGDVAGRLVADSRVRAVSLTGGLDTGRLVGATAVRRMAALQLELGGSNPALVAADADVDDTATALARGVTKLNGQWCEAPRRVMVASGLYADLREALVSSLRERVVGSSLDEDAEVGPLAHRRHLAHVRKQIASLGGRAITTAPVPQGSGFFLSPTVIVDVEPGLVKGEIFGPAITIHPVDGDREAVSLANDHGDGLAAYVFSADEDHAFELGRSLHAGEVRIGGTNILDLAAGSTQSFWGTSGIGAHGSSQVFEAFRGSRIVGQEDPGLGW